MSVKLMIRPARPGRSRLYDDSVRSVRVGIVGLGNVGSGTLAILTESSGQICRKLGFPLSIRAVCSRSVHSKELPPLTGEVLKTTDWREVVAHPEIDVVAELVGGTGVARD